MSDSNFKYIIILFLAYCYLIAGFTAYFSIKYLLIGKDKTNVPDIALLISLIAITFLSRIFTSSIYRKGSILYKYINWPVWKEIGKLKFISYFTLNIASIFIAMSFTIYLCLSDFRFWHSIQDSKMYYVLFFSLIFVFIQSFSLWSFHKKQKALT